MSNTTARKYNASIGEIWLEIVKSKKESQTGVDGSTPLFDIGSLGRNCLNTITNIVQYTSAVPCVPPASRVCAVELGAFFATVDEDSFLCCVCCSPELECVSSFSA